MIYARMSCDGCAAAEVEIPLPDKRPEAAVRNEALARGWQIGTIADLCPTCRAIVQLDTPPEPVTEAMF
jgi:hypothetical protein